MQITATAQAAATTDADTIAVGIFDGEAPPPGSPAQLGELLDSGEARRTFKSLALTHSGGKRWLLVGLGTRSDFTPERARVAATLASARAKELSTRTLCWQVPDDVPRASAATVAA